MRDISVIIPFYNGNRWLERALQSVVAQDGVAVEIIVVDDGSAEPPDPALVARYGGQAFFETIPHAGKGAAINAGAARATAQFLCILDQDDPMLPGRLAAQLAALRSEERPDAVYSDFERRSADGTLLDVFTSRPATREEHLHAFALNRSFFSMQTITLTRDIFARTGGFSTDIRLTGIDDSEFFVRLLACGARLMYVPGVLGSWTSHEANYSKSAAFHDTRLVYLQHLRALAETYPEVRRELPVFAASIYLMRGLFCLEHGDPRAARRELRLALQNRFTFNLLYLFCKACVTAS